MRRNGTPIDGVRVTRRRPPRARPHRHAHRRRLRHRRQRRRLRHARVRARGLRPRRSASSRSRRRSSSASRRSCMVPYEDRVTGVDLDRRRAAGRAGLARSPTATARAAPRCCSSPGTEATATLPDGTTKELGDRLNIRATEFTIGANGPAAMPGELPPTSAYTYAVEYSVDEANKDQARRRRSSTSRSSPTSTTSLGFPAGTAGPDGLLRPRAGAVDRGRRTAS